MPKITIGKRVPIENIRTIWEKESNFSDWLATPEGLELIAQDLEIQMKILYVRGKAPISCDIVANILGEEKHIVVIENQFGRTNHDHLAKLLTYAATQKAMTGIWMPRKWLMITGRSSIG